MMTKATNGTAMTIYDNTHERIKSVCLFLSEYASCMLAAGATSSLTDAHIHKIAKAYGMEAEISILPRRVMIATFSDQHKHSYTNVGRTIKWGINISTVYLLSNLSAKIEQDKLTIDKAMSEIHSICSQKRANKWLVLLSVGCANASFCRLFGGDAIAMMIVFVATIDGFYLKQLMLSKKFDTKIVTLVSALFAAIIGASGIIFHISSTPDIALATSVLYLVPGIPFINAISDILHGHHLCALSRLSEAVITTICMSLGLCIALQLTQIGWN